MMLELLAAAAMIGVCVNPGGVGCPVGAPVPFAVCAGLPPPSGTVVPSTPCDGRIPIVSSFGVTPNVPQCIDPCGKARVVVKERIPVASKVIFLGYGPPGTIAVIYPDGVPKGDHGEPTVYCARDEFYERWAEQGTVCHDDVRKRQPPACFVLKKNGDIDNAAGGSCRVPVGFLP